MLKIIKLLLLCTLIPSGVFAQGENNYWVYATGLGIDFNVQPPLPLSGLPLKTFESAASICDAQGNLLFYTIGGRVWNRNGIVMNGGNNLKGNGPVVAGTPLGSCANGVAIIKAPRKEHIYYVFSMAAAEDPDEGTLYYCIVDMSRANGQGEVISESIKLGEGYDENIEIARGPDCKYYWLIAEEGWMRRKKFFAYKIDGTGIAQSPVVSDCDLLHTSSKMSPNDDLLASYSFDPSGILLSRFDKVTGAISDFRILPGVAPQRTEFSPDGTKLFYTDGKYIRQLDLGLLPDTSAVVNNIHSYDLPDLGNNVTSWYTDIRRGPDSKIYVSDYKSLWPDSVVYQVDVIENPNSVNFAGSVISPYLSYPTSATAGLHSTFEFGQEARVFPSPEVSAQMLLDTIICTAGRLELKASADEGDFSWSNGDTAASTVVSSSGTYWVNNWRGCSLHTDSFRVLFKDSVSSDILPPDTILCRDTRIVLDIGEKYPSFAILWQDGSSSPSYSIDKGGTYWVRLEEDGCVISDTVHVKYYENCLCQPAFPNAFSPNHDGMNDAFNVFMNCPVRHSLLSIYNRWGQLVFQSLDIGKGWDGTVNGKDADVGTYYYRFTCAHLDNGAIEKKGNFVLLR